MRFSIKVILILLGIVALGLLIPDNIEMPVSGADETSYNENSYWHPNWGRSINHKGVDIFARSGTEITPATPGLVLFAQHMPVGGNAVVILGAKWRLHYYAHLKVIKVKRFTWASRGESIGTVGNTGNAKNTPSHLHYSIMTPIPHVWKYDDTNQGWAKMLHANPIPLIK